MYVCVSMCMCVCVFACVHMIFVYVCAHICQHTVNLSLTQVPVRQQRRMQRIPGRQSFIQQALLHTYVNTRACTHIRHADLYNSD